jgi:hypothetical protein
MRLSVNHQEKVNRKIRKKEFEMSKRFTFPYVLYFPQGHSLNAKKTGGNANRGVRSE